MKSFLVGLGFGVVGGLLLAAKRGDLTRADLRKRAGEMIDSASATSSRHHKSGRKAAQSASSAEMERESAAEILNHATREALLEVHGIGQVLANRIIENRPYQTAYEVVEKGILPESTFIQLRRELLERGA
jgi:DNA uptake protein ComE-like DNA-binding protein